MSNTHSPHRLVTPRVVDQGLDPATAEHLVALASSHLGSAVHTIERVGWGCAQDSDNWSLLALVSTGTYCAVVEQRMDIGVLKPVSVKVFRSQDVVLLHDETDADVFVYFDRSLTRGTGIQLPRGTRASDLMSVR